MDLCSFRSPVFSHRNFITTLIVVLHICGVARLYFNSFDLNKLQSEDPLGFSWDNLEISQQKWFRYKAQLS